jgi:hypothetical protein
MHVLVFMPIVILFLQTFFKEGCKHLSCQIRCSKCKEAMRNVVIGLPRGAAPCRHRGPVGRISTNGNNCCAAIVTLRAVPM